MFNEGIEPNLMGMEGNKIAVLLIDDIELDNFISSHVLKQLGVGQITVFQSAITALSHLTNSGDRYQLILVDAILPLMDGMEFIDKFFALKLNKEHEQLALLSATLNPVFRATAEKYNIPYIEKPLTINKLIEAKIHLV